MMPRALPWVAALVCSASANAAAQPPLSPTAQACQQCHADRPQGTIPALAEHDPALIVEAMEQYRSGARTGTIMNRIAKGYTPEEIRAIAQDLVRANTAKP